MWWFVFTLLNEWEEVQRAGTAGASGTDVQQKGWMPGFIILFFFRFLLDIARFLTFPVTLVMALGILVYCYLSEQVPADWMIYLAVLSAALDEAEE